MELEELFVTIFVDFFRSLLGLSKLVFRRVCATLIFVLFFVVQFIRQNLLFEATGKVIYLRSQ